MFNIPNAADAEHVSQAQPDSRDFKDMLAPAFAGTGVVSGCAVTPQGSPDMTLAVASGSVAVAGTIAAVTGGNVTILTAHATLARFDLVVVDAAGAKSVVAGTAAAAPVFPDPAGKAVLAAVRVPAAATSINAAKITDKRVTAVVVPATRMPGEIVAWAGAAAPTGWLFTNGAAVLRAGTYATLFALIGTTYGVGDGSTTFNLPDTTGRTLVSLGTHADISALAASDGLSAANRSPKHTATNGLTLPNHVHTAPAGSYWKQGAGGVSYASAGGSDAFDVIGASGNPTTNPAITGTIGPVAGATRPVDTPAFLVVNYIIKY